MHHYDLNSLFAGNAYALMFIFSRVGTALMLIPGIGESHVTPRARLFLALGMSLILVPVLQPHLPSPPAQISTLASLIGYEVLVGLFFGTLLRLVMDSLETAGSIVALQIGLSNATVFNPQLAAQSPLPSALYAIVGYVLIFVTGIDHMLLRGIVATYDLFPPGSPFAPGDMSNMVSKTLAHSFIIGFQLAVPFILIGLMMFLALGLLQRLMPMIQLFIIVLPAQIWGGLFLLGATITSLMTGWLRFFDTSIGTFFGG